MISTMKGLKIIAFFVLVTAKGYSLGLSSPYSISNFGSWPNSSILKIYGAVKEATCADIYAKNSLLVRELESRDSSSRQFIIQIIDFSKKRSAELCFPATSIYYAPSFSVILEDNKNITFSILHNVGHGSGYAEWSNTIYKLAKENLKVEICGSFLGILHKEFFEIFESTTKQPTNISSDGFTLACQKEYYASDDLIYRTNWQEKFYYKKRFFNFQAIKAWLGYSPESVSLGFEESLILYKETCKRKSIPPDLQFLESYSNRFPQVVTNFQIFYELLKVAKYRPRKE